MNQFKRVLNFQNNSAGASFFLEFPLETSATESTSGGPA